MSYQNLSVFSASATNFFSFPIVWAKQIMFVHHTDDVWYANKLTKHTVWHERQPNKLPMLTTLTNICLQEIITD